MKILMLSQDMRIFEEGSEAASRIAGYGVLGSVTLVVFGVGERKEVTLSKEVRAVCAGGANKLDAFFKGAREVMRVAAGSDIVSAQDPFFVGALGLFAARKYKIPFQAQLHTDCFSNGYAYESVRRMVEVVCAFFVLKGASCVRVVSERIAKSVRQVTSAPVSVLPIRVPVVPSVPAQKSGRFTAVAVSRFTKEKQIHLLLGAVAHVPDMELVLVGEGPLRAKLEQLSHRLGIQNRVRFVGWQDPNPYYASADVYVLTSRYEGYGRTLVEAALHNLPLVTTDVGIAGEVFEAEKEAIIVPAKSDVIAEAFTRLKDNMELRKTLGDSARKKAGMVSVSEDDYLAKYSRALLTCRVA